MMRNKRFFSHGKKPPKGYNPKAVPSEKSQWAYWMQAIEPCDPAIDAAFPGYHPLWVQRSQRLAASGEQFKFFRQHLLAITQKQCAAYMRVKLHVVQKWEQGREPIPFMAFELLRLVYEGATFKLSHKDWDGWFIEPKTGKLVSPDRGDLAFTPATLSYVPDAYRRMGDAEAEIPRLKAEIAALKAEAEVLREVIKRGGFIEELHGIKAHLESLLNNIDETTAKVYPFPHINQQRKAATA